MDCGDRPRRSRLDTQQMARISEIRSTDIMLGRGPKIYNNPGNGLLRELVKEHAVRYRHDASRREKTELITLLVSQLEAKGCRFLHLSSSGAWIVAPSRMIIKKVGHSLRDARLAVAKKGSTVTVIPKKARRSVAEKNQKDQVTPFLCGEVETADEKSDDEESAFTNVITLDTVTPQCDACSIKLQQSLKHLMASTSVSAVHLMQGGKMMNWVPIPETGQQLVDICMSSFPSELLSLASHQSPLVEELTWEKAGLSFFDREIEEIFDNRISAGHIDSITESSLAHPSSTFDFEIEGSLVVERHSERSEDWRCDMDDVLGRAAAPDDALGEGHVEMILEMEAGLCSEESFDDCLVEYSTQYVGYAVHDGPSLCRWFRNLW